MSLNVDEAVAKLSEIGRTGVKPSLAEPRKAPTQSDLDQTPLFMKTLPENYEENETIQALQSLTFDGSPDEVSQQFKDQANDYFKGKRFDEARKFYTQAIQSNPTNLALKESLYNNRAACNLELKNYGQCLKDTAEVLRINNKNVKSLYRSAKALNFLEKFEEATNAIQHILVIDNDNQEAKKLLTNINERYQAHLKRKIEISESQRRKNEYTNSINDAISMLGLIVKGDIFKSDRQQNVEFDNTYLPESSKFLIPLFPPNVWSSPPPTTPLTFPTNILYPLSPVGPMAEHIAGFSTISTFSDQLHPMLNPPPPWDQTNEYAGQSSVSVYVITNIGKILKVGMGLTLSKVLAAASKGKSAQSHDGIPLVEGTLNFIILPKGEKEKKWVEDYKSGKH